jgi:peroxiredoxin (alkyl hydroperoxide reductase subunit C)
MKKIYLTIIAAFVISSVMFAQPPKENQIPMLGEPAPTFTAMTTQGEITFPLDYLGKWKILFSHPADFTPVCSTEILDLAEMANEFGELNTQLVVLSTDGLNSHLDWIKSLEGIQKNDGKEVGIDFPLVPDVGLKISSQYGMIHPGMSTTNTIRGVFIISPEDQICAMFFYPNTTGRNLEEIKRTLIALQESDRRNVLTPSNWQPGDDYLLESPASKEEAEKMLRKNKSSQYSKEWYLWFEKNSN